jgi:hypothetical protein
MLSRLQRCFHRDRVLFVCAYSPEDDRAIIVTVYEPDPGRWIDLRRRIAP